MGRSERYTARRKARKQRAAEKKLKAIAELESKNSNENQ
jgi:hypothetical protein